MPACSTSSPGAASLRCPNSATPSTAAPSAPCIRTATWEAHGGASITSRTVSFFDTQNSTPNSEFHNATYLGNFGWQLLPNTELRATVRRSVSAFNSANAIALYGIPDDGVSRE